MKCIYVIKRISCTQCICCTQFLSFLILLVLYLLLFHLNPISCSLLCRTYCLNEKYIFFSFIAERNLFRVGTISFSIQKCSTPRRITLISKPSTRIFFGLLSTTFFRDTNQHLRIFLCSFPLRPMILRLLFTSREAFWFRAVRSASAVSIHGLLTLQKFSGLLMMWFDVWHPDASFTSWCCKNIVWLT